MSSGHLTPQFGQRGDRRVGKETIAGKQRGRWATLLKLFAQFGLGIGKAEPHQLSLPASAIHEAAHHCVRHASNHLPTHTPRSGHPTDLPVFQQPHARVAQLDQVPGRGICALAVVRLHEAQGRGLLERSRNDDRHALCLHFHQFGRIVPVHHNQCLATGFPGKSHDVRSRRVLLRRKHFQRHAPPGALALHIQKGLKIDGG